MNARIPYERINYLEDKLGIKDKEITRLKELVNSNSNEQSLGAVESLDREVKRLINNINLKLMLK
jgi:hypothetical protein